MMRTGTKANATIIAVTALTENKDKSCNPDMVSGERWRMPVTSRDGVLLEAKREKFYGGC